MKKNRKMPCILLAGAIAMGTFAPAAKAPAAETAAVSVQGEAVGLVCPVYYSGIPRIMLEFIRHVKLKGDYEYIYLVLTHGGGPGGAAVHAPHLL